jgi:hypothetical protein
LIAVVAIAMAGCSSSDGNDTGTNATSGTNSAETTVAPDDGSNENPAPEESSPPPPPADGRYLVGDTYYDVDLSATYLGLAQVPVGPDIFSGGTCYTVLLEVNRYADAIQLGPEKFQASTRGILSDGTEAERDSTGVGCDLTPLAELGYEPSIETGLVLGDTKRTYLGAIWVPDGATLDGVTLYGSNQTFLVADVVVDAAG